MKKHKRQAKSIVQAAGGSVVAQVHQVLGEADGFIGALADSAVQSVQMLRQHIGAGIGIARDALESLGEGGLDGARNALRGASGYVRQHPWQTAAGVIALGLTTAVLSRDSDMRRLETASE